jgi:hypothetical protein
MRNTDRRIERMSNDPQTQPMATVLRLSAYRRRPRMVFFSRAELNQLLSLYSRQVARGEWRDYAIDQRDGAALFSVFRHSQEAALYTIVKVSPGGRPGDFTLLCGRQPFARSVSLGEVLTVLQRKLRRPTALRSAFPFGSQGAPVG